MIDQIEKQRELKKLHDANNCRGDPNRCVYCWKEHINNLKGITKKWGQ